MKKYILILGALCTSLSISAQTIEEGLKYVNQEQFGKAEKTFKALVEKEPANPDYNYRMGDFLILMEEYAKAETFFNKGIELDKKHALSYVGLGTVKLMQGKKSDAESNYTMALDITKSKRPEVLFKIAEGYMLPEKKNAKRAIELMELAITKEKENPEYYILLGDAYLENREAGKANTNYDRVINNVNPNYAKAYIRSGSVMVRAKAYDEALKLYKKGLEKDPGYSPGYRELAELYNRAGRNKDAVENYRKYIENSDRNTTTLFRFGAFLFKNGNYNEAVKTIDDLVKSGYDNVIALRVLAYAKYESGTYAEGLKDMEAFMAKIEPERIITADYEYLGKLLMAVGREDEGMQQMQKAVAADPEKADLFKKLANEAFKAKDYAKAGMYYQGWINAGNKTERDYLTVGQYYYFGKQYDKADTAFAALTTLNPNLEVGFYFLGKCKYYAGSTDAERNLAIPAYEKYIELMKAKGEVEEKEKSKVSDVASFVAYYYAAFEKNGAKAKELYKYLLTVDPENEGAKAFLAANK